MRINQFIARATGISRRAADDYISSGRVLVNNRVPELGQIVSEKDNVTLDAKPLKQPESPITILINKPRGYVVSKDGQGSKTIYDLLPKEFGKLKPVGRLDKDSSGLLILSTDGDLIHRLSHPSFEKNKVYEIELHKELSERDRKKIEKGLSLSDGISELDLVGDGKKWTVTMHEGRNRQIRRTFSELNYEVTYLHRIKFDDFEIKNIQSGHWILLENMT